MDLDLPMQLDFPWEAAAPAPLLIVLGGGDFGREEVLLKKLELLIGLSRLAQYEKVWCGVVFVKKHPMNGVIHVIYIYTRIIYIYTHVCIL